MNNLEMADETDKTEIITREHTERDEHDQPDAEEIDDASAHVSSENQPTPATDRKSYIVVAVLFTINLLNYMDRFTIPAVMDDVKKYYGKLDDSLAGLLQTSFICSYMILSPVFGFIGDRYNRVVLMTVGIFFWSVITLTSSFIPGGRDNYWYFLLMRAMVGIGEASYSTVAPTIIADLFAGDSRIKALAVFYFAVPLGSGLGYIIGGQVAKMFGLWQAALRVTPIFGCFCLLILVVIVRDPKRGQAEGGTHLRPTNYCTDISVLIRNKSFMATSFGFTSVAFVAGALSWWAPIYITHANNSNKGASGVIQMELSEVSLLFGIITVVAGVLGVLAGSESARRLRPRFAYADPMVCGIGLIACCPFLFFALILSRYQTILTFVLVFIGETFLCFNWALVSDIVLSVVLPTRRATASAVQILMSHLLGDAGSPWIVGQISDAVQLAHSPSIYYKFLGLQYGLFTTVFVCALGGGCFLACALWITKDKQNVERVIKASNQYYEEIGESLEPSASAEDEIQPEFQPNATNASNNRVI